MDAARLLGRGVAFPPRLDEDGRLAWSTGEDNVRQSIHLVLATDPGERVMLPTFGAGLRAFLHQPNTPATHRLIEQRVVGALRRWEPRIELDDVRVAADPDDDRAARVTVAYRLVASGAVASIAVATPVAGG